MQNSIAKATTFFIPYTPIQLKQLDLHCTNLNSKINISNQ